MRALRAAKEREEAKAARRASGQRPTTDLTRDALQRLSFASDATSAALVAGRYAGNLGCGTVEGSVAYAVMVRPDPGSHPPRRLSLQPSECLLTLMFAWALAIDLFIVSITPSSQERQRLVPIINTGRGNTTTAVMTQSARATRTTSTASPAALRSSGLSWPSPQTMASQGEDTGCLRGGAAAARSSQLGCCLSLQRGGTQLPG